MLKLFITGLVILFAAIALNVLIQKLHIMGWYEFLGKLQGQGSKTFADMSIADYCWLFALYPLGLGLSAIAGEKLWLLLSRLL
ncbi:MAG: hypothetical protein RI973_2114 [Bacteroidota bacterium]|jgi:hypothetical protein